MNEKYGAEAKAVSNQVFPSSECVWHGDDAHGGRNVMKSQV